jgi:hypothetical protein
VTSVIGPAWRTSPPAWSAHDQTVTSRPSATNGPGSRHGATTGAPAPASQETAWSSRASQGSGSPRRMRELVGTRVMAGPRRTRTL